MARPKGLWLPHSTVAFVGEDLPWRAAKAAVKFRTEDVQQLLSAAFWEFPLWGRRKGELRATGGLPPQRVLEVLIYVWIGILGSAEEGDPKRTLRSFLRLARRVLKK